MRRAGSARPAPPAAPGGRPSRIGRRIGEAFPAAGTGGRPGGTPAARGPEGGTAGGRIPRAAKSGRDELPRAAGARTLLPIWDSRPRRGLPTPRAAVMAIDKYLPSTAVAMSARGTPLLLSGIVVALLIAVAGQPVASAAPSPLMQSSENVPASQTVCNEGLVLIIRNAGGDPACVTPGTMATLVARGWGSEPAQMMEGEMMEGEMMEGEMMEGEMMEGEMMEGEMMEGEMMEGEMMEGEMMEGEMMEGEMMEGEMMEGEMMEGEMMEGEMMVADLDLTDEEAAWISNATVRVTYDPDWPPFEFAGEDGELAGLSAAYLSQLEAITGADFSTVHADSWSSALGLMEDGGADAILMIDETDEWLEYMNFTEPHTVMTINIVGPSNRQIEAEDIATMRVGTIEGYSIEAWLEENMPLVRYKSYADHAAIFDALRSSEIDVFLQVWAVAERAAHIAGVDELYNLGEVGTDLELSIGYAKDSGPLGSVLQKALDAIPEAEKARMVEDALAPPGSSPAADPVLELTIAEQTWLDNHPTISVAYDPDWPPFEFIDDDGNLAGLTAGYVSRFEELTGADLVPLELESWSDALAAIKDGGADLAFEVVETAERSEYMGFTEPHTVMSWDMVTTAVESMSAEDLADKRVGTIRDYSIEAWLDDNRPDVRYTSFDSHSSALNALSSGDIDVFLEVWPVAALAAEAAGIDGLYNAGPTGAELPLAIGYGKADTVLASIAAKALAAIPEEDRIRMVADIALGSSLDLTDEEATWLLANPTIPIAYDPDFAPFESVDEDGMLIGLVADYRERFEESVGVDFLPLPSLPTWSDALDAMVDKSASVMLVVGETEDRLDYMNYVGPHTVLSWDIVTLGADPVAPGDLNASSVGTMRDYAAGAWFVENYPDAEYTAFDDHAAALAALESGELDAFLEIWPVAALAAEAAGIEGLHNAGPTGHVLDLSVGYVKDSGPLGSILQKALDAIPEDERARLADRASAMAAAEGA